MLSFVTQVSLNHTLLVTLRGTLNILDSLAKLSLIGWSRSTICLLVASQSWGTAFREERPAYLVSL